MPFYKAEGSRYGDNGNEFLGIHKKTNTHI